MKQLYLLDDAIISPLGFTTSENLTAIKQGVSGLQPYSFSETKTYAGFISEEKIDVEFQEIGNPKKYTKLEKMLILAIQQVLIKNPGLNRDSTALILSTTKGNIDLLKNSGTFPEKRIYLSNLAQIIADFFEFKQTPIVVSNACISGGLALSVAKRLMHGGRFKNAIVCAGDLLSDFVLSGFNSFQALSENPCKPFSKKRDGISLGEAAAAVLVSSEKPGGDSVSLIGEASVNDANHISGPSRTGEGLFKSITSVFQKAGIKAGEIGYISAHGTATFYNDEMESVAFNRAKLNAIPLNSFKGIYGHTLGASALIESILTKHSLLRSELYPSVNFEEIGVSKPVNIISAYAKKEFKYALKTASGFGGCNLALIFRKNSA